MDGMEQVGTTADVPPSDVHYAVDNALWVARVQAETEWDTRPFMEVFESQLTTHWRELQQVHPAETSDETSEDTEQTDQTTLVTDGGKEDTVSEQSGGEPR